MRRYGDAAEGGLALVGEAAQHPHHRVRHVVGQHPGRHQHLMAVHSFVDHRTMRTFLYLQTSEMMYLVVVLAVHPSSLVPRLA